MKAGKVCVPILVVALLGSVALTTAIGEPDIDANKSPSIRVSQDAEATLPLVPPCGCNSLDAFDGLPVNALWVDAVGDVGIGTTNPLRDLHLSRNRNARMLIEADANDNGDNTARLDFASGSFGGVLADLSVDEVRTGTPLDINRFSSSNVTIGFNGGDLGIGMDPVNRLSVDGNADFSGNIGIGTTTPIGDLHVSRAGDATVIIEADSDNFGDDIAGIAFDSGSTVDPMADITADEAFGGRLDLNFYSPNHISLALGGGNVGIGMDPVNRLSVDGDADFSGNVGIGLVAPAEQLHVANNARVDGIVYAKEVSTPDAVTPLKLQINDTTHLIVETDGKVGIGAPPPAPPTEALEVNGYVKADGFIGNNDTEIEVSALKFVKAGFSTVTLMPTANGAMQIRPTTAGTQIVMLPVDLPTTLFGVGYKLESVRVAYKVSSASSYISATGASCTQDDDTAMPLIEDDTDWNSQTWDTYTITPPGPPAAINGPLFVDFNLFFTGAQSAHDIYISRVTVTLTQS